jgi:hypothetical protein
MVSVSTRVVTLWYEIQSVTSDQQAEGRIATTHPAAFCSRMDVGEQGVMAMVA